MNTEPVSIELILGNDATLDDDGWALIAPFGEHRKTRQVRADGRLKEEKFIQVLDNASAQDLVSEENGLFRRIKRAIVGIPVYCENTGGAAHPDLKDFEPNVVTNGGHKIPVGVVDKVRLGNRGVEAHFILTNDGARAVETSRARFPSAVWECERTGMRDGAILARPYKLLSVGLTAHPNISGVDSLANSTSQQIQTMRETILGLLIGKGVVLPNEATDQQIMDVLANGDYPGHPFHGNQYADGSSGRSAREQASGKAHSASITAFKQNTKASHEAAAMAHRHAAAAANKAGNKDLALYHDSMANMHADAAKKASK